LPPTEAPKEPQKENPPAPAAAAAPEPIKIIVEQPAPIQEPPPVVEQPPVHQPPPPPQQFEPQSQYAAVPSTMGVSLEDLSDKICLIEQNIQLQSQTNEQIHRIILGIGLVLFSAPFRKLKRSKNKQSRRIRQEQSRIKWLPFLQLRLSSLFSLLSSHR
jgi:hypothetical protein